MPNLEIISRSPFTYDAFANLVTIPSNSIVTVNARYPNQSIELDRATIRVDAFTNVNPNLSMIITLFVKKTTNIAGAKIIFETAGGAQLVNHWFGDIPDWNILEEDESAIVQLKLHSGIIEASSTLVNPAQYPSREFNTGQVGGDNLVIDFASETHQIINVIMNGSTSVDFEGDPRAGYAANFEIVFNNATANPYQVVMPATGVYQSSQNVHESGMAFFMIPPGSMQTFAVRKHPANSRYIVESSGIFYYDSQEEVIGIPDSPTNIVAGSISDTTILVSWNSAPGAQSYLIQHRVQGTSPWFSSGTTTFTSFSIGELAPGTNYEIRVSSVAGEYTIPGAIVVEATLESGVETPFDASGALVGANSDANSYPELSTAFHWVPFAEYDGADPMRSGYIMWTAGGTAGASLKSIMIFDLSEPLQAGDVVNEVQITHWNNNVATAGNRTFEFRGLRVANPIPPSDAASMLALVNTPSIRTTARQEITAIVGGSPAAYFNDHAGVQVNMATLGEKVWSLNPAIVQEIVSSLSVGQTISRIALMTDTLGGAQPNDTQVAAFEGSAARAMSISVAGVRNAVAGTAPGAVTNLSVVAETSTSIAVNWFAGENAANYRVEYRQGTSGAFITATTTSGLGYTLTGLTPSTLYQVTVTSISASLIETLGPIGQATTAPASGGETLTITGVIAAANDDAVSNPNLAEQWHWRPYVEDVSGSPDRHNYIMWTAGGTSGTELKSLMIFTLSASLQPGDTIVSATITHYNSNIATAGNRNFTLLGVKTLNPAGPTGAASMLALVNEPSIRTTANHPIEIIVGGSPAAYFNDYVSEEVNMATLGTKTWRTNPAIIQELVSELTAGQTISRLPLMTDVPGEQPNNTEVAAFEADSGQYAVAISIIVTRAS